jgi:hypothetical protein
MRVKFGKQRGRIGVAEADYAADDHISGQERPSAGDRVATNKWMDHVWDVLDMAGLQRRLASLASCSGVDLQWNRIAR